VFVAAIVCVLGENPSEPPMKPANGMRTNAVKKSTAAIVDLLAAAAFLTAILYFSFTMEF
jgi:hypothetical protein